jgi:hypothetical protein
LILTSTVWVEEVTARGLCPDRFGSLARTPTASTAMAMESAATSHTEEAEGKLGEPSAEDGNPAVAYERRLRRPRGVPRRMSLADRLAPTTRPAWSEAWWIVDVQCELVLRGLPLKVELTPLGSFG